MLQRLRERTSSESGFTLIELLVVMLILGILAAIAIPSFFNQRDKARDADAKSAVRTAQTAMETYASENNGVYTNATVVKLQSIEPTLNDVGANLTIPAAQLGAETYRVSVLSATGNTFMIDRLASGQTTQTCTVVNVDGCPADGNWD